MYKRNEVSFLWKKSIGTRNSLAKFNTYAILYSLKIY